MKIVYLTMGAIKPLYTILPRCSCRLAFWLDILFVEVGCLLPNLP